MRRYWREVKRGETYRPSYTSRHFNKRLTEKLRHEYERKKRKKRIIDFPPSPFVSLREWVSQIDRAYHVAQWHPNPGIAFKIQWVLPQYRFGLPLKRLPQGAFLPSRSIMVYFLVRQYRAGFDRTHVVGWRVVDFSLPWKPYTLPAWLEFIEHVAWPWIEAGIDERNLREATQWEVSGVDAIVLWHFVKEAKIIRKRL